MHVLIYPLKSTYIGTIVERREYSEFCFPQKRFKTVNVRIHSQMASFYDAFMCTEIKYFKENWDKTILPAKKLYIVHLLFSYLVSTRFC